MAAAVFLPESFVLRLKDFPLRLSMLSISRRSLSSLTRVSEAVNSRKWQATLQLSDPTVIAKARQCLWRSFPNVIASPSAEGRGNLNKSNNL